MNTYNIISKGDTVYLGLRGEVAKFTVYKIEAERVALTYTHENVVHVRWVPREKLLKLLGKAG